MACGTGRLLVPYRQAGLDVDGCDVSADMVAACRSKLEAAGVDANVWVAAMDELEPPRRYRTIFVCGGFGLGATRERDLEALRRFHAALEPGGTLVFDVEMPYSYSEPLALLAEGRPRSAAKAVARGRAANRLGRERARSGLPSARP